MTKHPAFHACTIRDTVTHCDWLHPNRVPSLARSMRAVTCCRFGQTTCIIITRTATPTQMKDKQETRGGASSLSIAPPTPLCAPTMPREARLFLALKFTIRKPPSPSRETDTEHICKQGKREFPRPSPCIIQRGMEGLAGRAWGKWWKGGLGLSIKTYFASIGTA